MPRVLRRRKSGASEPPPQKAPTFGVDAKEGTATIGAHKRENIDVPIAAMHTLHWNITIEQFDIVVKAVFVDRGVDLEI